MLNVKYWSLGLFLWACFTYSSLAQDLNKTILQQEVTASFKNKGILDILYELEQQYPIYFFYKEEWISRDKMDISFKKVPLGKALQDLFKSTNLGFFLIDDHLILVGRRLDLLDIEEFSYSKFVEAITTMDQKKGRFLGKQLVIGDSLIRPIPATAMVSGKIISYDTEEPLAGSQIAFPDLETGTFADSSGAFALRVPTGRHKAVLSAAGHDDVETQLAIFSDGSFEVELAFTSYQMEEVLLQADAAGQSSASNESGRVNISMIDIKRMPSLMGEIDIINTILLMPGVSTSGEASSGFNIRGGNVDQNLVLYGGNMVFNTSHLLGFFSIFNPEVVEGVSLYKGHIPAQYGGRISSVLDVGVADGSYRKFQGSATVGLLSSKVNANGPIKKGSTSFNVGLRAAYPDVLTNYFGTTADVTESSASYGDIVLKLSHKINESSKVSVMAYASQDRFSFSQNFGYDWSNLFLNVQWQQIYSSKLSTRLEVNGGRYQSELSFETPPDSITNTTGISNYQLKYSIQYSPNRKHNLNIGLVETFYDIHPDKRVLNSALVTNEIAEVAKPQGLESAIYINDDYELNDLISISAGVRLSMFNNMGPYTLFSYNEGRARTDVNIRDQREVGAGEIAKTFLNIEPRISMRMFLDDASSIKASYNRTSQYVHLLSNTASIAPVDIWQVSDNYFPPQTSNSFSAGIFKDFSDKRWQTSVEFFYRQFGGQVVAKNFASFLNNENVETEVLNAKGRAYGTEVSIALKTKKLKVDGAFTYMRTLRQTVNNPEGVGINKDAWFPADFDSPYNVSLTAIWTPNLWQSLSINFIFRTGRPISRPIGSYPAYPSWNIPAFSERNNSRIPDYHRFDISYSIEPGVLKRRKTKTKLIISVYNVYARKNPFSVFYRNEDGKFKAYQLSILGTALPFIGYNFSF